MAGPWVWVSSGHIPHLCTERQTGMKTLPSRNFFGRVVNIIVISQRYNSPN